MHGRGGLRYRRGTMPTPPAVLSDRRHPAAFALGCLAVAGGVVLHLPMFWVGRDTGFRLADMPMNAPINVRESA
jgi:hypothetical protein